ncbi:hypothetical protein GH714_025874 [Hevea brasiliensis]|uniref:Uncharacterized protein n=1 Tax=Hevea brasiliensis TaxID=3981 RepID=A0A6A6NJ87_HEVBR|nr:hypothetical protein GH714_025874 [Hevea brasiliensis]
MMERLILMEDMTSEIVSLASFVEIDMSKIGHATIQVSLGERYWPPAVGYSFICWFPFKSFLKSQAKETEPSKVGPSKRQNGSNGSAMNAISFGHFLLVESSAKHGDSKSDGSGIVWDLERLGNLSLQLSGKKLIFAFDGTYTEAIRASGTFSLLNLVDPMQCVIGDTICLVGRIPVVLALVEAAETSNMLHTALTLLACVLHQNPRMNHNLTILRRINRVQQLCVTLQHGDVEVSILEKLVVFLGVILEDGFMASELENVVKFVIMTFDPPDLKPRQQIMAPYAVELCEKEEEKNLNDCDDTSSSQNTFSCLPHEREQSAKTSISVGSFLHTHGSTSSEDMLVSQNYLTDDKVEIKITDIHQNLKKNQLKVSVSSSSSESNIQNIDGIIDPIQVEDSQSSASLNILDSPIIFDKSTSRVPLALSSSPIVALTSWLGGASHDESKNSIQATPSIESFDSASEFDASLDLRSTQGLSTVNSSYSVSAKLLLEIDDSGYGGGPCSAGAIAMLDFMAQVLFDFITEQMKAARVIEGALELAPLYVDAECLVVFLGFSLSRLMNFVER